MFNLCQNRLVNFSETLLVWISSFFCAAGCSVIIARSFHLSFDSWGASFGILLIFLTTLVYKLFPFSLPSIKNINYGLCLFCISIFSIRIATSKLGSDFSGYAQIPTYLLNHPDIPLDFAWHGVYSDMTKTVAYYSLSYTYEFFLALIAHFTNIDFIYLSTSIMPAIFLAFAPVPIYACLLLFKASKHQALMLTILTFCLYLIDAGSRGTAGAFYFHYGLEGKGILISLGIPSLIFFIFKYLYCNDNKYLFALLISSIGFSLVTLNTCALFTILSFLMILSFLFISGFSKFRIASLGFLFSAVPAATIFVVVKIIGTMINVGHYESAYLPFLIEGIPLTALNPNLIQTFNKGFDLLNPVGLICALVFIPLFLRYKNKLDEKRLHFLYWFIFYVVLILNPLTWIMVDKYTNYGMPYYRFFNTFPLLWLPSIFLSSSAWKNHHPVGIRLYLPHFLLCFFLLCFNFISVPQGPILHKWAEDLSSITLSDLKKEISFATPKAVTAFKRWRQASHDYSTEKTLISKKTATKLNIRDDIYILGPRRFNSFIATIHGGCKIVAGKDLLNETIKDNQLRKDILKATVHLQHVKKALYPEAFVRVVDSIRPEIIIGMPRQGTEEITSQILSTMGYKKYTDVLPNEGEIYILDSYASKINI